MRKTVCLIGRPNTGKSSLFNRLVNEKRAIVADTPGVTRDRLYGVVNYKDKSFSLIDTGGIDLENATFNDNIRMQAELAMDEADVIVFVVDGREDITLNDLAVRDMLLRTDKKVIVALNKIDDKAHEDNIYNYYELGFENIITCSAEHKRGIDKLLDEITNDFPVYTTDPDNELIKFAIIGRPNVGKSSLLNMLLEEERAIVSHYAGTTRDTIEGKLNIGNITLNLIDTAGIRESDDFVEQIGINKAKEVLDMAELVLLVLDNSNITDYDLELLKLTEDKKRIIILNKMDLNNKANINEPHIMISALKGEGMKELETEILRIAKVNELNQVDATYLTNARQVAKLDSAYKAVLDAISSSKDYLPVDMVELDIKKAWDLLGEIIGIASGDELINELFSKFCLGK